MDRHYSTLELVRHHEAAGAPELVKHDETANAPERDHDATAFELDAGALAPQAVPDTTPQVFYDTSFPEAHIEESTKERTPSHHITKPVLKWPVVVVALVVAAAIAIGIGVGVGIWRHRSSHNSSTIISPLASPNLNITPTIQLILNDTSLAAFSLANGDRQLFFQDNTGLIRRAIRTASNSQWNTSSNLGVDWASDAKNRTPLAVTVTDPLNDSETQVTVYYVSENYFLSGTLFDGLGWTQDPTLGNYSTAVDTRSLSTTTIRSGSSDTNATTNSALLYYENADGKVAALLQRITDTVNQDGQFGRSTQWVDITSQQSKSLPNEFRNVPDSEYSNTLYESVKKSVINATFSTPFTSGANFFGCTIGALFYSPPAASLVNGGRVVSSAAILSSLYTIGPNGPGNFSEGNDDDWNDTQDYTSIHQSDVAVFGSYFGIWINGTQPAIIDIANGNSDILVDGMPVNGFPFAPNNAFPFARLASVTSADQSTTFLYHQMNGTTFAEEQWDASLNAWIPTEYITVSDH